MAKGRDHDRATALACIPFGLVVMPVLGIPAGCIAGLCFLIGGLWLSPDLDTRSKPLHRWGPLRVIWWPYRRLIPHRSLFSHGPLIGMSLRVLWLVAVGLMAWLLLRSIPGLGIPDLNTLSATVQQLVQQHPGSVMAAVLGLEASVWLHLLLDGDPLPMEWHRHRRQSKRR